LHRRVIASGLRQASLAGSIRVGCTADTFQALPPQTRLHPAKNTAMASSRIYGPRGLIILLMDDSIVQMVATWAE
jgi:hypothetical protein